MILLCFFVFTQYGVYNIRKHYKTLHKHSRNDYFAKIALSQASIKGENDRNITDIVVLYFPLNLSVASTKYLMVSVS